jgi:hypothetical protein
MNYIRPINEFLDYNFQILNEDIYGRYATVYHLTRYENIIDSIYEYGFFDISPYGVYTYGLGLYAVTNLEDAKKDYVKYHGNFIVKFQISIENFLILDFDTFKISPLGRILNYTEYDFIFKQLDYYKIDYTHILNHPNPDINLTEKIINSKVYTSEISKILVEWINGIETLIDGILFTDVDYGQMVVCYRPNELAIPISYSDDNGETFVKSKQDLKYFKNVLNKRQIGSVESYKNQLSKYGILELIGDLTLDKIKIHYPWILKANISGAILSHEMGWSKYTHRQYKNIIWQGGDWYKGVWEDGNFLNGKWFGGNFKRGVFEGEWLDPKKPHPNNRKK